MVILSGHIGDQLVHSVSAAAIPPSRTRPPRLLCNTHQYTIPTIRHQLFSETGLDAVLESHERASETGELE